MESNTMSLEEMYARLALEGDDGEGVIVGETENAQQQPTFVLIGRFLTDKNINFQAMQNVLASIWRPREGMEIHDLGGRRYSFIFYHVMDIQKVVEGGPWTFEQSLLLHHKLEGNEDAHLVKLNKMEIWVQVYDIPKGMLSSKLLESTAIKKENEDKKRRGEWMWVNFKYERLSTFYFVCGLMGHSDRDCGIVYAHADKTIERSYGTWLRAPARGGKNHNIGERWLRNGREGGQSWKSDSGRFQSTTVVDQGEDAGERFMDVDGRIIEDQKSWDVEIISELFTERDKKLILQIPIPLRDKEDSWYWALEDKGLFSVKSCYKKIRGEYDCVERMFWKKVWGLQLPGKMINFIWRACSNVLPTAMALHSKQIDLNPQCSWCHVGMEDAIHLLFECSIAREVWSSVGLQDAVKTTENDTVTTVFKRVSNMGTREQLAMVGLFCWSLWSRRNRWVWEKVNTSVFGIKALALNVVADWRKARMKDEINRSKSTGHCRTWQKPPENWVKINVDASYRAAGGNIGVGCVARDSRGRFLRARTNVLHGTTQVREAEAWSLKEAIEWMRSWRNIKCIFESDAKLLVDAFQRDRGRSNFDTIVEACSDNLKHFEEVSIVFVSRSANIVAHELARAACSMSGPMEWVNTAPDFISCNIDLEAI